MAGPTKRAVEAVQDIFGDRSVPPEETAARLKLVKMKCDENLAALRGDGVDVRGVMPAEEPV